MKFEEAVAELAKRFGPPAEAKGFDPDERIIVASGGVLGSAIDETPALSKDRGYAVRLWFETAVEAMRERSFKGWAFLDGPHCDTWRITIQDEKCTHRIAADRFSVISTIGLAGVQAPEAQASEG